MTNKEFQAVFEGNQDAVYGFAWRMTRSRETAEDIAQDCFLQLLKSPGRFESARGSIRAWLLGVARNLILKRWRADGRWSSFDDEEFAVDVTPVDCRADEQVANAVEALPPLQREALILFEYEGLTLAEIALAVGAEIGTVKARLNRARNNLRQTLEPLRSATK